MNPPPEGHEVVAPVRRGRRNPELAEALGIDDPDIADDGVELDVPIMGIGDVAAAKATIDILIDGRSNWFTYEARTRIMPGESEEEANERIQLIVNVRALELADDMEARLAERAVQRRSRPIQPR